LASGSKIDPISPNAVATTFDAKAIRELARLYKLPNDADLVQFGRNIRIAAEIGTKAASELPALQMRDEIKNLYRLTQLADSGTDLTAKKLAAGILAMPPDVRKWLEAVNARHGRLIPSAAEILDPVTRQEAVNRIRLVLSWGGSRTGRKRPSGRRSWEPFLRLPMEIKPGRPARPGESEFVFWLGVACVEAGKPPSFTANHKGGPFWRLVHRCFEMVGMPTSNIVRLIEDYGRHRRWAMRKK
jgi:hypothetical protein